MVVGFYIFRVFMFLKLFAHPRFFILHFAILCLVPAMAQAETALRDERRQLELPVDERLPEELQAPGMVYRGFAYAPRLTLQGKYDNNIYATPTDEKSDYSLSIQPELTVKKEFSSHKMVFGGKAEIERFADHSDENKKDYSLFARARLVGENHWELPLSTSFDKKARDRITPQITRTGEPEDIKTFNVKVGVRHNFNRFSLALMDEHKNSEFDDGTDIVTGAPVIYSDNDYRRDGVRLESRYEMPGGNHILFGDIFYGQYDYDRRDSTTGLSGSRDEYGLMAGVESNYKGLIFSHIGAGGRRQSFDDSTLDNISILDLQADIAWNILPKLTLKVAADRNINQDNGFTQGIIENIYGIGADYEFLHNLYFESDLGYATYDFKGTGRDDTDHSAGIGLKYYNSRRFETGLSAIWQRRDSNTPAAEFDRTMVMLSLTGKL